ncbi:Smr/MutS family protein [Aureimonas sp. AU40]|uniref:Smr/MutS family protein n=1 Tax=Aureimonas sp. AU40 TaxID=1637747 RepID=UPI000785A712|nr:Smr/MutS family protein [Aureimonas sp. AU40]
MKKRRSRSLSTEETRLWVSIARTATPLKGKSAPALPPEEPAPAPPQPSFPSASFPPASFSPPPRQDTGLPAAWSAPPYSPVGNPPSPATRLPPLHPIERPTRRKIGKGRIALDDRIDLHGQTEAAAHGVLLFFLRQAQARGFRHVLVITGRGASYGSTGTLKRAMPHWFSTGEFRSLVAGYEPAERGHGGEGAFYVRVRRP